MKNIKEEVLKEEIRKQKIGEVQRFPFDEFWFAGGFDIGWDENLVEVGKVIDEWKEVQGYVKGDSFYLVVDKLKNKLGIK